MKRYKITIYEESPNGKGFFGVLQRQSTEEAIFQVILTEDKVDIQKVMETVVGGKECPKRSY